MPAGSTDKPTGRDSNITIYEWDQGGRAVVQPFFAEVGPCH